MTALRAPMEPAAPAVPARPIAGLRPEDSVMTLRDGRQLGYAQGGDPAGRPVFFFHGFGTTRVVCPPEEPARELGIRLIAVDRPGIGLSDPLPGRRLLDWPDDIAELRDRLDVTDFSVVGWSGGGPYALACAAVAGASVRSVGLVSAPAPLAGSADPAYLRRLDRNAVRVAGRAPWVIRLAMWHWGRPQRRDARAFFDRSVAEMCAADQAVLADEALRVRMIANSAELYRQGGRGMYDEALVLARPWGFELSDVRAPVHVWQGTRDDTVPEAMAHHLVRELPNAKLRLFEQEGHHLLYRRWPEILAEIA